MNAGYSAALIAERRRENAKTVSLVFDQGISCSPGQFVMVWLPGLDEKPFSIAGRDPLEITVAQVGPFSHALHSLSIGDTVWYRGPFGRGFSGKGERPILVGGGYGAAPLFFLSSRLMADGVPPDQLAVALGARTASDLLFVERFRSAGARVLVTTDDGSAGARGVVTDAVGPLLRGADRVYACGPEKMLEAVAALCRHSRTPGELSHEAYMRCGVGLCGACECEGRLVCLDGPVFPAEDGQ